MTGGVATDRLTSPTVSGGFCTIVRQDLPIQPVSRQSGFVAEMQLLVTTAQFAHQLRNGVRRIVECAEIPHLAVAARFCHRDRVVRLGGINPDENLAPLLHGSSPVRRGVPGPST